MTQDEAFSKVQAAICARFGFPLEGVTLESDLYETLGLDSLDSIDLIIDLEKMAGRRIREEELGELQTVGDVVQAVCRIIH